MAFAPIIPRVPLFFLFDPGTRRPLHLRLFLHAVLRRAFRHNVNGALEARPCVRMKVCF